MNWPEISIQDFPPRRDDEPSSLRQDIIDELSDHFACALNRELLKNPDEQVARKRVREQFGDPIKVARQLWLEAMKEKIMSQRILTGVSVVMAVCGFIVVGLVWSMMKQNERVNLQVLEQLTQLSQQPAFQESAGTEGMNQITFELIQSDRAQQPAVGFAGVLTKMGNQTDSFTLEAVSDQAGKLDFGKLPWGKYRLSLTAPWGENADFPNLTVIPGRDYSKQLVCPAAAPRQEPVAFRVDWTDQLKAEDWCLLCDLRDMNIVNRQGIPVAVYSFKSMREYGGTDWISTHSQGEQKQDGVYLVDSQNQVAACPLGEYGALADLNQETLQTKPELKLPEGKYILPVMYLVPRQDLSKLSTLASRGDFQIFSWDRARTFKFSPSSHPNRVGFREYLPQKPGYFSTQSNRSVFLVPFQQEKQLADDTDFVHAMVYQEGVEGVQLPKPLVYSVLREEPNLWKIKLPE